MGFIEQQSGVYWVEPDRLAAGQHPSGGSGGAQISFGEQLAAAGFSSVIDLTEAGSHRVSTRQPEVQNSNGDKLKYGIRYRRFPIPDMQVPSVELMADLLDYLEAELSNDRQVYLHCAAGLGRTGTVVGCYLVRQGSSGEQALTALKEMRRSQGEMAPSPETEAQRRFVRAWQQVDPALQDEPAGTQDG